MKSAAMPAGQKPENKLIQAIQETVKWTDEKHVELRLIKEFKEFGHLGERAKSNLGQTPLQFAASIGNRGAVKWLLDDTQHKGRDPRLNQEPYALALAVSYHDDGSDSKEGKGEVTDEKGITRQARRAIIDMLCEAYHQQKKSPKDLFEQVVDAALVHKNIYVLHKLKQYTFRGMEQQYAWMRPEPGVYTKFKDIDIANLIRLVAQVGVDNYFLGSLSVSTQDTVKSSKVFAEGIRDAIYHCIDRGNIKGLEILTDMYITKTQTLFNNKGIDFIDDRHYIFNYRLIKEGHPHISYVISKVRDKTIDENIAAKMIELFCQRGVKPIVDDLIYIAELRPSELRKQLLFYVCRTGAFFHESYYGYNDNILKHLIHQLTELELKLVVELFDRAEVTDELLIIDKRYMTIGPEPRYIFGNHNQNANKILFSELATAANSGNFEVVKKCMALCTLEEPVEYKSSSKEITNYLKLRALILAAKAVGLEDLQEKIENLLKEMPAQDVTHLLNVYRQRAQYSGIATVLFEKHQRLASSATLTGSTKEIHPDQHPAPSAPVVGDEKSPSPSAPELPPQEAQASAPVVAPSAEQHEVYVQPHPAELDALGSPPPYEPDPVPIEEPNPEFKGKPIYEAKQSPAVEADVVTTESRSPSPAISESPIARSSAAESKWPTGSSSSTGSILSAMEIMPDAVDAAPQQSGLQAALVSNHDGQERELKEVVDALSKIVSIPGHLYPGTMKGDLVSHLSRRLFTLTNTSFQLDTKPELKAPERSGRQLSLA